MKKFYSFLVIIASFVPVIGFAFFCPKNFNQIQIGDPIDRVITNCGKPDNQKETTKTSDNVPQQWSYFVPQKGLPGPTASNQGSIQAVLSFDANGNLINILVNNVSVTATNLCRASIQLGDTRDNVKAACGAANFINKQTISTDDGSQPSNEVKVVQYLYNSTPPVTLFFENGFLKSKQ